MTVRKVRYEVCVIESERGWSQKREYEHFNTYDEAAEYRDRINSYNKPLGPGERVPEWYMVAEQEIRVREVTE